MKLPKNKNKYFITALVIAALFFFLIAKNVSAVDIAPFTVAPSRQEITVDPGEITAVNLKFYNRGDTPVSGIIKAVNFIVENDDGSPTFLEQENELSPDYAAASWVTLPYDRISIAAKDNVQVQVKLKIPEGVKSGGKYFAVYFEPTSNAGIEIGEVKEGTTPTTFRIAGLVYLRVAGPVKENAYATQLKAPRFSEYGPVLVSTEILNKGNYHIKPKGVISLTSIFGKKIDEVLIQENNIFPDISRMYENEVGKKWMMGRYKIELSASYGETGQIIEALAYVWVFPWKLATAIILGIVIIILLAAFLHKKFKKEKEDLEEKVEELESELEKKSE